MLRPSISVWGSIETDLQTNEGPIGAGLRLNLLLVNLRGVEEEEEEVIAVDSLEEPSLEEEEEEDEGGEANGLNIRDEAAEAAISKTSTAAQREKPGGWEESLSPPRS